MDSRPPVTRLFSSESQRRPSNSRTRKRRNSRSHSADRRSSSVNGRRSSIADSYPRRSFSVEPDSFQGGPNNNNSIIINSSSKSRKPILGSSSAPKPSRARRWDGNNRSNGDWDSMRRDPELWFPGGNCLVHLYAQGQSRRGPSIRCSVSDLDASNCMQFFGQFHGRCDKNSSAAGAPNNNDSSSEDGGFHSNPRSAGKHELFVPAPVDLDREEAFDYHLTTRNFFAWMFDIPLVGVKLGESLIRLHERMNRWRPDADQNLDDMLAYIDQQGYSDFRDCPDHALAVLSYAEKFQLADLWIDAFVHCAGMNESLVSSLEFNDISRTTRALITRASLEMNVRLERASVSLAGFMEDELTAASIKLPESMLKHMERFRSFLHSFYVQRHGYWPPHNMKPAKGKPMPLAKHTLLTMYTDFRNLYEFIADQDSSPGMQTSVDGIYGSVDIAHAAFAFDKKRKFNPLPHSLPLVPTSIAQQEPAAPKTGAAYFLRFFQHANKRAKLHQRTADLSALQEATNVQETKVMNSPLVKEYGRFEREFTLRGEDEKLSVVNARKARWLVVYAQLQTLIDLTRAPDEVRDTEGVEYPLCAQTAGTPPWAATSTYVTPAPGPPTSPGRLLSSVAATESAPDAAATDAVSIVAPSIAPSARPPPLDLHRVATNKRASMGAAASPVPSIGQISVSRVAAPPLPSSTPKSSIGRALGQVSSNFLNPRRAATPKHDAGASDSEASTAPRGRTRTRRSLGDRFGNTTLGLIFAPQPVRPLGNDPESLLSGGETKLQGGESRTRGRVFRGGKANASNKRHSLVESLRGTRYNASTASIAEIDGAAADDSLVPPPTASTTGSGAHEPVLTDAMVHHTFLPDTVEAAVAEEREEVVEEEDDETPLPTRVSTPRPSKSTAVDDDEGEGVDPASIPLPSNAPDSPPRPDDLPLPPDPMLSFKPRAPERSALRPASIAIPAIPPRRRQRLVSTAVEDPSSPHSLTGSGTDSPPALSPRIPGDGGSSGGSSPSPSASEIETPVEPRGSRNVPWRHSVAVVGDDYGGPVDEEQMHRQQAEESSEVKRMASVLDLARVGKEKRDAEELARGWRGLIEA